MAGTGGVERDYIPLSSGPSGANAPAVVTIQRRSGARIQLGFCHVSYSAAPAGGRLTISDTDVPKVDLDLTTAGVQLFSMPGDGISFEAGQAVTVTLAAAGAAVVGKISLGYRYIYDR